MERRTLSSSIFAPSLASFSKIFTRGIFSSSGSLFSFLFCSQCDPNCSPLPFSLPAPPPSPITGFSPHSCCERRTNLGRWVLNFPLPPRGEYCSKAASSAPASAHYNRCPSPRCVQTFFSFSILPPSFLFFFLPFFRQVCMSQVHHARKRRKRGEEGTL